ncbi:hypothetical protein BpHYR1_006425 [Brachionus plicatilis]|uniref:Uncharacterized protein n=1 Tax=Brachionus plicatilis TaxID=10195 RepID=A0A3M7RMX6_BRAPC|nr:hypothetical protein BpHYR1_006425 [Brachionus plicatilis]
MNEKRVYKKIKYISLEVKSNKMQISMIILISFTKQQSITNFFKKLTFCLTTSFLQDLDLNTNLGKLINVKFIPKGSTSKEAWEKASNS